MCGTRIIMIWLRNVLSNNEVNLKYALVVKIQKYL